MSDLNEKQISKLIKLCRIECTEEEKEKLLINTSKILTYIKLLNELDTEQIPPCIHVIEEVTTALRKDEMGPTLSREEFLANVPSVAFNGMVQVPPILKPSH